MALHRTNIKELESLCRQINAAAGMPSATYTEKKDGKRSRLVANVVNFYIDGAYGGHQLVQVVTEGGGIRLVTTGGYIKKSALADQLRAILTGIQIGKASIPMAAAVARHTLTTASPTNVQA